MALNVGFIKDIQSPQITQPDPIAQYAKGLHLKQMMTEQQGQERALADENASREALRSSGGDMAKFRELLVGTGNYKRLSDFDKQQMDQRKGAADVSKTVGEAQKLKIAQYRDALANVDSPQAAAQWMQAQYKDPDLGGFMTSQAPFEQAMSRIPQDPQAFNEWRQKASLGMSKFTELNKPSYQTRNLGGTTDTVALPGLGGAPSVVSSMRNTQSPDSIASQATAIRGQNMTDSRARERLDYDKSKFTNQAGDRKPMTAAQEAKYRDEVAKDYQAANTNLANMDDVLRSINEVRKAPGLNRATGLMAYVPSMPGGDAAAAEVKLKNLEGKITQLGKAAAAQGGAIGPMAVQEWKIVRDMIAAIDPAKGKDAMLEQIDLIENNVRGATERIKDAYSKQYSPDSELYPQFQELKKPSSNPSQNPGGLPDISAIDAEIARRRGKK